MVILRMRLFALVAGFDSHPGADLALADLSWPIRLLAVRLLAGLVFFVVGFTCRLQFAFSCHLDVLKTADRELMVKCRTQFASQVPIWSFMVNCRFRLDPSDDLIWCIPDSAFFAAGMA